MTTKKTTARKTPSVPAKKFIVVDDNYNEWTYVEGGWANLAKVVEDIVADREYTIENLNNHKFLMVFEVTQEVKMVAEPGMVSVYFPPPKEA